MHEYSLKNIRLISLSILLLILFVLIFPKAGFKFGELPITFGYVILACLTAVALAVNLYTGKFLNLSKVRWITLGIIAPFQFWIVAIVTFNGYDHLGFMISLLVSFLFLPTAFLIIFSPQIERMPLDFCMRLIRFGVGAVAVYGILLFIYKNVTGDFIEIPYLTINADDAGTLEEKSNNRYGIFKLISTYNNGNIYGVCILMLLPLYELLEPKLTKRLLVKTSLILTLSRTVWLGLLIYELSSRACLSRPSIRAVIRTVLGLLLAVGVILMTVNFFDFGEQFLFDKNLGGRLEQFETISLELIPTKPYAELAEVIYLSVLKEFGIVGLIAFIMAMASPLVMYALKARPYADSGFKRSVALGLLIYLTIAWSDGAILYIPVMVFYWFLVSLLLANNLPSVSVTPQNFKLYLRTRS